MTEPSRGVLLRTLLASFTIMTLCDAAQADQPRAAPADNEVASSNGRVYAHSDFADNRTFAYRRSAGAKPVLLWEMPGWFPVAALSSDGRCFAVGHPGNNLLPAAFTPNVVIVSFFLDGKLSSEVRLSQLMAHPGDARRTISHREWGTHMGFDGNDHYQVRTVDGFVVTLDPLTGNLLVREPSHQPPKR